MKPALLFVLLLAACDAASADEAMVLSSAGLGDIKIGAKIDAVERAARTVLPYNPFENHGCSVTTAKELEQQGLSFVFENRVLTRINVDFDGANPLPLQIKTDTGVGLSSSEEDVTKAYAGRLRIVPNEQDPTWHTIFVDDPDHTRAVVFETDGKKVKSIRAGEYPTINGREGCS